MKFCLRPKERAYYNSSSYLTKETNVIKFIRSLRVARAAMRILLSPKQLKELKAQSRKIWITHKKPSISSTDSGTESEQGAVEQARIERKRLSNARSSLLKSNAELGDTFKSDRKLSP